MRAYFGAPAPHNLPFRSHAFGTLSTRWGRNALTHSVLIHCPIVLRLD